MSETRAEAGGPQGPPAFGASNLAGLPTGGDLDNVPDGERVVNEVSAGSPTSATIWTSAHGASKASRQ